MIYRRFAYLQTRLLLHKQERSSNFERKLRSLDHEDFRSNPEVFRSCTSYEEHARPKMIYEKIESNLMGYNTDSLSYHGTLLELPSVSLLDSMKTLANMLTPSANAAHGFANYNRDMTVYLAKTR